MEWLNLWGVGILVILMIPNCVYAIKAKDSFENKFQNKAIKVLEQIGRFGCFGLMMINIPYLYYGFWIDNGLLIYCIVNGAILSAYCSLWVICWKKDNVFRALALSILPSCMFLFSGIMLLYIPLIAFAVIFAFAHITISYKNAVL